MKLPTMVYRVAGELHVNSIKQKQHYIDYEVVDGYAEEGQESELDKVLKEGKWFATPQLAIEASEKVATKETPAAPSKAKAPPSKKTPQTPWQGKKEE